MNKKYLVFGLLALLVLGAVVALLMVFGNKPVGEITPPTPPTGEVPPTIPPVEEYVPKDGKIEPIIPLEQQADYIIDITSAGFSPETMTVAKGNSVIWTNRDRYGKHGIKSVGEKYPEAGDCGTKMDTCGPMSLGESFRVTFDRVGTWQYQDTEKATFTGTIIVK